MKKNRFSVKLFVTFRNCARIFKCLIIFRLYNTKQQRKENIFFFSVFCDKPPLQPIQKVLS